MYHSGYDELVWQFGAVNVLIGSLRLGGGMDLNWFAWFLFLVFFLICIADLELLIQSFIFVLYLHFNTRSQHWWLSFQLQYLMLPSASHFGQESMDSRTFCQKCQWDLQIFLHSVLDVAVTLTVSDGSTRYHLQLRSLERFSPLFLLFYLLYSVVCFWYRWWWWWWYILKWLEYVKIGRNLGMDALLKLCDNSGILAPNLQWEHGGTGRVTQ